MGKETVSLTETNTSKQELFRAVITRSGMAAQLWIAPGVTNNPRGYLGEPSTMDMDAKRQVLHAETMSPSYAELNAQGVSEIVTIIKFEEPHALARTIPGSNGEAAPMALVTYEATGANRYYARDHTAFELGSTNPGAEMNYQVVMSLEDAATVEAAIIEDPASLHQLTDTVLVEGLGFDAQAWHDAAPQYDAWRDANNGVNYIALRQGLNLPTEQSQILSY